MVNHIILLSGKSGSGKDTVANIIQKYYPIIRLSFATSLKQIVSQLSHLFLGLKIDPEKMDSLEYKENPYDEFKIYRNNLSESLTIRKLLQTVADDILKPALGKEIFVQTVVQTIKEEIVLENTKVFVITDLRYLNEYTAILDIPNTHVSHIRIIRDDIDNERHQHGSERNYGSLEPDHYVQNNGTFEELENQIEEILSLIFQK